MNKFKLTKETFTLIIQNKVLRISFLVISTMFILSITLLYAGTSFAKKVQVNYGQIQDAQSQLIQLQKIVNTEDNEIAGKTEGREFATYDQIVPFIGLLESLFAIIDSESKITVKNQESEIYINRYADYEIQLSPRGKMELFLKALKELHEAKYLTKIINFTLNYTPTKDGAANAIKDATLTIRLYFE